jgi:hypothetical protein
MREDEGEGGGQKFLPYNGMLASSGGINDSRHFTRRRRITKKTIIGSHVHWNNCAFPVKHGKLVELEIPGDRRVTLENGCLVENVDPVVAFREINFSGT